METIELSIGTVKIKPLTNKIFNRALAYSTVIEKAVNNARFLNYCERKMTQIHFWKWGSLTIADGNKLRDKIKSMLKKDGVISEEKKQIEPTSGDTANLNKQINHQDQQWFNSQGQRQKQMIGGK